MDQPTAQQQSPTLSRALGLFSGTMLVAGFMIGTGIFKKIVPMAQSGLTGGEVLLAWVLAGVVTYMGSSIVADISGVTEESGGTYEYLRMAFGKFTAFIFGWTDFMIIGCASLAAIAFVLAQTINTLVLLPNPFHAWSHLHIGIIYPFADSGIKIFAIASLWIFVWVNCTGVRKAGNLNNLFSVAKIAGILLLIIGGLFLVSDPVAEPLQSKAIVNNSASTFSLILGAMLSALWAYDGWVDISFVTGEIKNPKRNVPLAIIIGVSVVMILYVLVNYAYLRAIPAKELATLNSNQIGAAVVAEKILGPTGKLLMVILLITSVSGALNAIMLAHSRIFFRMAQEKSFFRKAAIVNPQTRTPNHALIYTGIWSSILIVSGTFDMLTDMVIFAGFMFYALLIAALFKFRQQGKLIKKPFLFPWLQIVMLLFSIALVINTFYLMPTQSLIGAALVLSSVPFYYVFKRWYGKEG